MFTEYGFCKKEKSKSSVAEGRVNEIQNKRDRKKEKSIMEDGDRAGENSTPYVFNLLHIPQKALTWKT